MLVEPSSGSVSRGDPHLATVGMTTREVVVAAIGALVIFGLCLAALIQLDAAVSAATTIAQTGTDDAWARLTSRLDRAALDAGIERSLAAERQ